MKKMWKRPLAIVMAAALLFSTACGNGDKEANKQNDDPTAESTINPEDLVYLAGYKEIEETLPQIDGAPGRITAMRMRPQDKVLEAIVTLDNFGMMGTEMFGGTEEAALPEDEASSADAASPEAAGEEATASDLDENSQADAEIISSEMMNMPEMVTSKLFSYKDGSWTEEDAPWLEEIAAKGANLISFSFDAEGNRYLLYTASDDSGVGRPYVAKVGADNKLSEIDMHWKVAVPTREMSTTEVPLEVRDADFEAEAARMAEQMQETGAQAANADTTDTENAEPTAENASEGEAEQSSNEALAQEEGATNTADSELPMDEPQEAPSFISIDKAASSDTDEASASDAQEADETASDSDAEETDEKGAMDDYYDPKVPSALDIGVNSKGEILIGDYTAIMQYSPEGQYIAHYASYTDKIIMLADRVYAKHYGMNGAENRLFDTLNPTASPEVLPNFKEGYGGYGGTALSSDGQKMYELDSDGLRSIALGDAEWQEVASDSLYTLAQMDINIEMMATDGQEFFVTYSVYSNESGSSQSFVRLEYDDAAYVQPTSEITLYALYEDYTIKQAIARLRKSHPEIKVNFEEGMPVRTGRSDDGSATSVQDVINALNVRLLAGEGPDMFLLDNLPIDSYIEKGVLADMTDYVNEQVAQNGWNEGAAKSFSKDGEVYAIPSGISVPVLLGDDEALNTIKTLDDLVSWAKTHTDKSLFYDNYPGSILQALYPIGASTFVNQDGQLDTTELARFLTQVKEIWESDSKEPLSKKEREEIAKFYQENNLSTEGDRFDIESISLEGPINFAFEETQFSTSQILGYADFERAALKKRGEGYRFEFMPAGDRKLFIPTGVIGINAQSEEQQACRYLIDEICNGKAEDGYGFMNGTPLNLDLLMPAKDPDPKETGGGATVAMIGSSTAGGEDRYLEYDNGITKANAQEMIDFYKKANTPVIVDYQLSEAVQKGAKEFFDGKISAEEAAKKIEEQVMIYMNE